jgi:hypothetical protein
VIRSITLVVVARPVSTQALRSLSLANTCGADARSLPGVYVPLTGNGGGGQAQQQTLSSPQGQGVDVVPPHSGVLASVAEKTARALRPALIVLLGLSIVLLAIASLPALAVPDPRLQEVLARHRPQIAALGAGALVAAAIAFFVG